MTGGSLVLATRSTGKLRELRALFESAGFAVRDLNQVGLAESPDEDALEQFATFEENALAKGRYFSSLVGAPVVADDSGLEVDALGGRPGVRSKRWSGRTDLSGLELDAENNRLLIETLGDAEDRAARYVCAAAYVDGPTTMIGRGVTTGWILREPRGDAGFGYDPFFLSDELGRTFGEASSEEKARVSHRARACRVLIDGLRRR